MFQTEPILFLQSFSNHLLDFIFIAITHLGDKVPVVFFIIAVIFGIDFRKGFILLHILIWTAFATGWLKDFFALPRPYYVDSAVRAIGKNITTPTPYKAGGGNAFWSLPDKTAIEFARWYHMGSFGFPSGHTSSAVALWGGLVVLFHKKWMYLLCGLLMILIPFSRLYLGRHFIGDVLGGYILGVAMLGLIWWLALRRSAVKHFLFRRQIASKPEILFLSGYLFGLPLLIMLVSPSHATYAALLLGVNLGFFLVQRRGLPDDSGSVLRRILRVGIAVLVFLMTEFLFNQLLKMLPWPNPSIATVIGPVLLMTCFVWAVTEINIVLGLMKRKN